MMPESNLESRSRYRPRSRSRSSSRSACLGLSFNVFLGLVAFSNGLSIDFLESLCGTTYPFTSSFQLESSTGITYKNLLDCTLTVTAPSGRFVLAHVTRFELEAAVTGICTDYLDVHNGSDASAPKLNPSELCGWGTDIPSNLTSSGQSMTLRFVTDNKGVYSGFNMVFAAVYNAPCSATDFACTNGLCVDKSVQCDNYDQCGDNSDEQNCENTGGSSGINVVMVAVIAAVVVTVIAVVATIVIYNIRDRSRWKRFVNARMDDDDDGIVKPPPSYPITHVYYAGIRGQPALYPADATANVKVPSSSNELQADGGSITADSDSATKPV